MKQNILAVIVGVFLATIYFVNSDAFADNAAKKDTATKVDEKQAAANAPTEAEFMKVMEKCAGCHKPCSSLDDMKKAKWVVPGKPENSRVYNIIGKNKKADGTYHNLTDEQKKLVNDFIKNMK